MKAEPACPDGVDGASMDMLMGRYLYGLVLAK